MAKDLQVTVPDIGDYADVPVIEVLVKVGDTVEKDAPLVTLESDKATLDVPSPEAGTIKSIKLKAGDKVSKGDAVLVMEAGDGGADSKIAKEPGEPAGHASGKDRVNGRPAAEPEIAATARATEKEATIEKAPSIGKPSGKVTKLEVKVPDIGDYHDVPIIEVLVKDGDVVERDSTLLTMESDKATLDVPSPGAGVVSGLKLKVGDRISKGTLVCMLESAAADGADGGDDDAGKGAADAKNASTEAGLEPSERRKTSADETKAADGDTGGDIPDRALSKKAADEHSTATAPKDGKPVAEPAMSGPDIRTGEIPYASPSIRKFARELGVDLGQVRGTGQKNRITHEDVQGYVKASLASPKPGAPAASSGSGIAAIPPVDFAQFGKVESKPLARIRKLSSAHLHRAWLNVPHVTQDDEADITDLEAFRKTTNDEAGKDGVKLTLLPFIIKAVVKAIDAYPEFASSLSPDGENLIMKQYRHIGFAADTPNGLVVPVVRDADRKGISQLATETAELAKKARDGKLKGEEMRGGVFSISSLGGIGGGHFTPIVNAPEVAILGVSRGVMKPVWDGVAFQPRLMVPLSLSYDHRVIDGAYAARFIVQLTKLLSDLRRLAL